MVEESISNLFDWLILSSCIMKTENVWETKSDEVFSNSLRHEINAAEDCLISKHAGECQATAVEGK